MASYRYPPAPVDRTAISTRNGVDQSVLPQLLAAIQADSSAANAQLSSIRPSVTTLRSDLAALPNVIKDVRASQLTRVMRSDGTAVINEAAALRGGVFVNYSPTTLYLQIHGVGTVPAANVQPEYPPIPVAQGQVLILDQALLGVDGFGYAATTVRVSTTVLGYTPTATTAGLWAGIFRLKGA